MPTDPSDLHAPDEARPIPDVPALARWALWLAAIVLLAWSYLSLRALGAGEAMLLFLPSVLFVSLGLGALVTQVAEVRAARIGGALGLVPLGWGAAAMIGVGAAYTGTAAFAVPTMALLAVAGVAWSAWRRRAGRDSGVALRDRLLGVARSGSLALQVFLIAALWRVFTAGSTFLQAKGAQVVPLQYFDLGFHLAFIKAGLYRGLPVGEYPLMSGLERLSYHPGFGTLGTLLVDGLRLPPDAGYYALILPMSYVVFALSVASAAFALGRSWRAVGLTVGMGALTLLGMALTPELVETWGRFGAVPLQWFMFNPPGALAGAIVFAAVALLAAMPERSWRVPAVTGALFGALIAMKAQFFATAWPAFLLALLTAAVLKRMRWLDALAGAVAAFAVAVPMYLTTRGATGGPKVEFGAMAQFLQGASPMRTAGGFFRAAAEQLSGPLGDSMFLLLFVFFGIAGWRMWVALASLGFAIRSQRSPFPRSPVAWLVLGWTVLGIVAVAFTLVQRETYVYLPWNIAWHAMQLMWPISLLAAGVWLDAALPLTLWPKVAPAARWTAIVVGSLALVYLGYRGVGAAREIGKREIPGGFVATVRAVATHTPPDAVVVQRFEVDSGAWISGFGGRVAFLERLDSPELTQGQGDRRFQVIRELYGTTDPVRAWTIAAENGIDYAIVPLGRTAHGLHKASTQVYSAAGWELRRMRSAPPAPKPRVPDAAAPGSSAPASSTPATTAP